MTRLQWLTCWDKLRESLSTRTTWGRNQILEEMDRIEREMVRESEKGAPAPDLFNPHTLCKCGHYISEHRSPNDPGCNLCFCLEFRPE